MGRGNMRDWGNQVVAGTERESKERSILIEGAIVGFREKPGVRENPRNPDTKITQTKTSNNSGRGCLN